MGKEEKAAARINQLPGKIIIAPVNTQTSGSAHAEFGTKPLRNRRGLSLLRHPEHSPSASDEIVHPFPVARFRGF
jgi:hypothetical protein